MSFFIIIDSLLIAFFSMAGDKNKNWSELWFFFFSINSITSFKCSELFKAQKKNKYAEFAKLLKGLAF